MSPGSTTLVASRKSPGWRSCCGCRPRPTAGLGGPALRRRLRYPGLRHPHRVGPLQPPHPGAAVATERARRPRHPARQDLLREDRHPHPGPPAVRRRPRPRARDLRPMLRTARTVHCLRDEAAGPRRRRTHRAGRPPDRSWPGTGGAGRPAAQHLRPVRPRPMLFGFFAAMVETERESIREATLEGVDAAASKGKHGSRPPVITDDMLHTVQRRRAVGESVEKIRPDLIVPASKRKPRTPAWPASTGRSPSVRSARRTPKPSKRSTPASPPSKSKALAGHSELLVISPELREDGGRTGWPGGCVRRRHGRDRGM